MEVNGLRLPDALERIVRDAHGEGSPWFMKKHVDAYGEDFDASGIEVFGFNIMVEETADLPHRFPFDHENEAIVDAGSPGFIPYIYDYSRMVAFGKLGSGEPFCLDYRDNLWEPKVIFREDSYWRRVAPTFAAFRELIEPFDLNELDGRTAEETE